MRYLRIAAALLAAAPLPALAEDSIMVYTVEGVSFYVARGYDRPPTASQNAEIRDAIYGCLERTLGLPYKERKGKGMVAAHTIRCMRDTLRREPFLETGLELRLAY